MQHLELVEPRPDRLGALHVQDGGEPLPVEVGRGLVSAHDAQAPARRRAPAAAQGHLRQRLGERLPLLDRLEVRARLVVLLGAGSR